MATISRRTIHAFSSFTSMASSSSRVRIARTPVPASPFRSPTMLVASRITAGASAAARGEEADQRAGGGSDADRAPRIRTDIGIGARHRELGAIGHALLDLAIFLL